MLFGGGFSHHANRIHCTEDDEKFFTSYPILKGEFFVKKD